MKKSIHDGRLTKVSETILNSPTVAKSMSYSSVAKRASSVMFVKPKNKSQSSGSTKTVIKDKIYVTKFPIRSVREVNNGGIAIECDDKNVFDQLKADAESNLGPLMI